MENQSHCGSRTKRREQSGEEDAEDNNDSIEGSIKQ